LSKIKKAKNVKKRGKNEKRKKRFYIYGSNRSTDEFASEIIGP